MKTLFSFLILSLSLISSGAQAQAQAGYPNRPVTMVVGFSPGGIGDGLVRQISELAREKRGANVIVDFKPGAASTISAGLVKRAAPDGYTVSLLSPSALYVVPHFQKLPYDPLKDFTYMGLVMAQPYPMYVLADSPYKNVSDVLTHARKHPGEFKWGTAGSNTLGQILMQSAFEREKVDTTTVPFKGGADAINALLGGHIDAVVSADFGPMLNAGKVRLLVETGETRPQPNVPTLKDLGYPLAITLKYGVYGPGGMPADVVNWWDSLLKEFAKSPAYVEFAKKNFGIPIYSSPADTTSSVKVNYVNVGEAIKKLGLQPIN